MREVRVAFRVRSVFGMFGTLCYESSWLIGSEQEVCTGNPKNPFHITHHPTLLAALGFTIQSCRELIGMSSEFQRWQLYSSWHLLFFSCPFFSKTDLGREKIQRNQRTEPTFTDKMLLLFSRLLTSQFAPRAVATATVCLMWNIRHHFSPSLLMISWNH